jgi:hypothetical protein
MCLSMTLSKGSGSPVRTSLASAMCGSSLRHRQSWLGCGERREAAGRAHRALFNVIVQQHVDLVGLLRIHKQRLPSLPDLAPRVPVRPVVADPDCKRARQHALKRGAALLEPAMQFNSAGFDVGAQELETHP